MLSSTRISELDRVRVELDDNQVRRKPIVAIGNAGYLFGKCAVHESFDQ